ncbi:MAG: serine hydrolase [Gemmatimonadota bacterium]
MSRRIASFGRLTARRTLAGARTVLASLVCASSVVAQSGVDYAKGTSGTRFLEGEGGFSIKMLVEESNPGGTEVEIGEITFPAGSGATGGGHVHSRTEIFYVVSGTFDHVVNGEAFRLTPGMVGIVRPGDEVIHRVIGDEPVRAVVVWAPGGEIGRFDSSFRESPIDRSPTEAAFDASAFDAYVSRAVEDWDAPGLAVAVVKNGEILFEKGYGVLAVGEADRVDEHTRFSIGSTTKAMTAAAIGMLVEERKVRWDDPVTKHLPGFQLHDPYVTREVTVRDLLTHRAGLGNADFLWYGQDTSTDEIMSRIPYIEETYSFRSSFLYQNIMYIVAGEVIEAVSGMSWADFVRTRIFEPLGMTETFATLADTEGQPNVARPHEYVDGELVVIENASVDPVAPAGSVWSSVHDMSKWLRMLLADGKLPDGSRLLRASTVAELFTPQVVQRSQYPADRLTSPNFMTYGLAWFQKDYRGRKIDYHTGSIDGMVAIAGLIREQGIGVYVLGNRDHVELRHALMYRVFDSFDAHGEARDWSAELLELYAPMEEAGRRAREAMLAKRVEGTSPTHELDAYTGVYSDRLYGTIEVTEGSDGLRAEYGPGLAGVLEHWSYDTFLLRFDARWRGESLVTFRLGTSGDVEALEMGRSTFRKTGRR